MTLTPFMNNLSRTLVPALLLATTAALHAAPDNDTYAGRAELLAGPAIAASNTGATLDAGEALPAGSTAGNYEASVWWHWKPIFNGWYEITTAGSAIDTVLSVWTSSDESSTASLTLVHVNSQTIQFYADNATDYKIAVASAGSVQGAISLRASYVPDPFAKVVSASFDQTSLDVTAGTASATATLTIEASRELSEGTFSVVDAAGLEITSAPFSAANRVSGNVASGVYEVSFTLPQYIAAGSYGWNLSVANSKVNKTASQGAGAVSPLNAASQSTLSVINNGVVDGYAQWVAEQGGGSLSSLVGGKGSLDGALSLDTYAFGLTGSPLVVADGTLVSTGAPNIGTYTGTDGAKRLRVEYSKRKDSAKLGVGYRVQFSEDLVNWVDAVLPAVTLAASGAFEAVAVEDTVTVEDVAARFARVLVERTTP